MKDDRDQLQTTVDSLAHVQQKHHIFRGGHFRTAWAHFGPLLPQPQADPLTLSSVLLGLLVVMPVSFFTGLLYGLVGNLSSNSRNRGVGRMRVEKH